VSYGNGSVKLEYLNEDNEWVPGIDFLNAPEYALGLSKSKYDPNRYRFDFPYGIKKFRFIARSNSTTSTNNKGRICIGNIGFVFTPKNYVGNNTLYLSMISDSGGSSSLSADGHAYLNIYNNSISKLKIGEYDLRPFEGFTLGLYGNRTFDGINYNVEYNIALSEAANAALSSSSSSTSSSGSSSSSSGSSSGSSAGSSGSSNSSGGSQQSSINLQKWSNASAGTSTWLYNEFKKSLIVSPQYGVVSITEEIDISLCQNLSNVIFEHKYGWSMFYNCSDFAIDMWNSVSNRKFEKKFIQTPADLKNRITNENDCQYARNLIGNADMIGYFNENGEFVKD
jgi:hypothetical protein